MAKNKLSPTELDDGIYQIGRTTQFKLTVIIISFFSIGLLSNFPVKENLALLVSKALNSNKGCPISYEKIDISFLLPKITIKNTVIDGNCLRNPRENLSLNDVNISFYGPSISPLGLKFKVDFQKGKTDFQAFLAAGLGSQVIRIEDSEVDSATLNTILGGKFKLRGTFSINSLMTMANNQLDTGNFLIKSKNFSLPAQKISGFDFPYLPIENLLLKATVNSQDTNTKMVDLVTFELGSNESPILAQIKGPLKLNARNMPGSELSLNGKVKFSKSFLEQFSILNLFLGDKTPNEEGFFSLNVGGTLAAPKPKFL